MTPRAWHIDTLGAATVLALAALGYYTVVRPHARASQSFEVRLAQAEEADGERVRMQAERDSLRAQLRFAEEELGRRSLQLRPASELNRHLAAINELGTEIGVRFDSVRPHDPTPSGTHVRTRIEVGGSGSYPGLARFIHVLGDRFRDTRVVSVQASVAPDNEGIFALTLEWLAIPAR